MPAWLARLAVSALVVADVAVSAVAVLPWSRHRPDVVPQPASSGPGGRAPRQQPLQHRPELVVRERGIGGCIGSVLSGGRVVILLADYRRAAGAPYARRAPAGPLLTRWWAALSAAWNALALAGSAADRDRSTDASDAAGAPSGLAVGGAASVSTSFCVRPSAVSGRVAVSGRLGRGARWRGGRGEAFEADASAAPGAHEVPLRIEVML